MALDREAVDGRSSGDLIGAQNCSANSVAASRLRDGAVRDADPQPQLALPSPRAEKVGKMKSSLAAELLDRVEDDIPPIPGWVVDIWRAAKDIEGCIDTFRQRVRQVRLFFGRVLRVFLDVTKDYAGHTPVRSRITNDASCTQMVVFRIHTMICEIFTFHVGHCCRTKQIAICVAIHQGVFPNLRSNQDP